jgi:rubredoxin
MSEPPPIPPRPPQSPPPNPAQPLPYAGPPSPYHSGIVCPNCGMAAAKPVSFTMWGGVLGPKLLNHHKCEGCGFGFNGKTGKSNTGPIWIYRIVSWSIAIVALLAIYKLNH